MGFHTSRGERMREKEFRLWLLSRGFADLTIKHSINYIKYLERKGLEVDSVDSIEDVLLFFGKLRSHGTRTITLNYYIRALNRYFEFRGVNIKLKYYRRPTSDFLWIPTDEEVQAILSIRWSRPDIDLRNRCMLHLLFATGVRLGELINLNWQDLNIQNSILTVRTAKRGGVRYVPVPPKVLNLLQEYRKVRINSDPNAIFTTPTGRISHAYARKVFKDSGIKAGVRNFHAHAARHWRAVKWLEEGLSLETIRRLLGHSSLKSTQIYLRARPIQNVFDEVLRKDTFWWGPHGVKYLKKRKGDEDGE